MTRTEYEQASRQFLTALPSLKRSEQTIRSYSGILSAFENFLNRTDAGGNPPEQITPITVGEWRNSMSADKSPNTVAHYMTVLGAFFRWCINMGISDESPVKSKEMPKKQRIEYDLLSLDEIMTILQENPKKISKSCCKSRAIVVLLIQTGIRNAELRNLKLSDLDFERGIITVEHGKGDKFREIPFPALSRQAVENYLNSGTRPESSGDGYLFGSFADGIGQNRTDHQGALWHPLGSFTVLQAVKRYTARVCGHGVGVHALRHAYASLCDHCDIPLRQIQESMGHSSYNTTLQVYISVLDKSRAAKNISSAFDNINFSGGEGKKNGSD